MNARQVLVMLVVVCAAVLPVRIQQPVHAQPSSCEVPKDKQDKTPVILVHGWTGNTGIWDGMVQALEQVEGIYVAERFDYFKTNELWVSDPTIGPRLAERIVCHADASRRGKVIVVAHSMGGLAARYAANLVIGESEVSTKIGLVITLGTPHTGSAWGNVGKLADADEARCGFDRIINDPLMGWLLDGTDCLHNDAVTGLAKFSQELRELKPFPKGVPVRAIAGDITVFYQLFFTNIKVATNSDRVVGIQSATNQFTETGRGDGRVIFSCQFFRYDSSGKLSPKGGECEHSAMLRTPYIQENVILGVKDYVSTLPLLEVLPPELPTPALPLSRLTGETITLHGLTIPMRENWASMADRGFPSTVTDWTNAVGSSASFAVLGPEETTASPLESLETPACWFEGFTEEDAKAASTFAPLTYVGERPVGTKTARYYEANLCTSEYPVSRLRVWEVEEAGVRIVTGNRGPLAVVGLDESLENATWDDE